MKWKLCVFSELRKLAYRWVRFGTEIERFEDALNERDMNLNRQRKHDVKSEHSSSQKSLFA